MDLWERLLFFGAVAQQKDKYSLLSSRTCCRFQFLVLSQHLGVTSLAQKCLGLKQSSP